jgi:2-amino-4-hydroxy-6-hydroxymethyldihydropteridine diphosphokinase
MALIIATGSNLGNPKSNLYFAKKKLSDIFKLRAQSQVFWSEPVDFEDQPAFYNQVLEFETPHFGPLEVLQKLETIEKDMGKNIIIPKGPRLIDLDLLFYGFERINSQRLTIPHPRLFERSFVVLPLKQLPFYRELKDHFDFPHAFKKCSLPVEGSRLDNHSLT